MAQHTITCFANLATWPATRFAVVERPPTRSCFPQAAPVTKSAAQAGLKALPIASVLQAHNFIREGKSI